MTQKSVVRTYQSMNPLDEAGAWGRAAAGDGDAFGRLFDAHHRRVFRHGLRLTGDVHDAEDVLAAAFLELWRRRKDVRVVDGSVLPWLLVTAGNLALNQGRGLRRHPDLLAAIKTLSSTDQQLLALVALEDYPLRAAAQALGLTEHAARSRWQRIRRRLAQNRTPDLLALALEH